MGYHFGGLVIVCLVAQGCYGVFRNCKIQECDGMIPNELLQYEGPPLPNEAELKQICPYIMRYMFCAFEKIESCEGMDMNRLVEMSRNETAAKALQILKGVFNLLVDVCNDDSELHKGYVENIDCFRGMFEEFDPSCLHTAESVYKSYDSALQGQDQEQSNRIDKKCMIMSFTLACFTGQVKQQCGESAGNTMIEFTRRVKFIGISDCTEADSAKLRGQFSDLFEFADEEDENIFRDVFAVLKRRK